MTHPSEDETNRDALVVNHETGLTEVKRKVVGNLQGLAAGSLDGLGDQRANLKLLAPGTAGKGCLLEINEPGVKRTAFMTPELGPMNYELIRPAIVESGSKVTWIAETTPYCQQAAAYRTIAGASLKSLTDQRPNFLPAALDMLHRQAVMRDRYVRFPSDGKEPTSRKLKLDQLDWTAVVRMNFTSDGAAILLFFRDRGAGVYELTSDKLIHRFPAPSARAPAAAITADGRFAFVLEENKSLICWDINAFGPDGWAAVAP
jgi:hypothetical protein